MEQLLRGITKILCNVYAPSHHNLYSIRRMGITGEKVHHKDRKKELSSIDKREIGRLLAKMMGIEVDSFNQVYTYYRAKLYEDMYGLLCV
jgi:hypothetical protein